MALNLKFIDYRNSKQLDTFSIKLEMCTYYYVVLLKHHVTFKRIYAGESFKSNVFANCIEINK